jgi:hypothetical protein
VKTITVLCAPCKRNGKPRQKIGGFDDGRTISNDGPYDAGVAVHGWKIGGQTVTPKWTGPDGTDKVHLSCGYGHERQIARWRILAALDAAPDGESSVYL